jgi:hypothetical protein
MPLLVTVFLLMMLGVTIHTYTTTPLYARRRAC